MKCIICHEEKIGTENPRTCENPKCHIVICDECNETAKTNGYDCVVCRKNNNYNLHDPNYYDNYIPEEPVNAPVEVVMPSPQDVQEEPYWKYLQRELLRN